MGSKMVIFSNGKNKADKLWFGKQSKAKHRINLCLVCIYLFFLTRQI